MIPVYQTRVGSIGNCFAACLASICEAALPEFGLPSDAKYDEHVDAWLAKRGLRYAQVPIEERPVGWSTIEGVSPRGGMHACVAYNGVLKFDPHRPDGTGNGLIKPEHYGLLLPIKGSATDATLLSGKRLHAAAEALRAKHDELKQSPLRTGNPATAYNALRQPTVALVAEAEKLLANAKLDDDPAYWRAKTQSARKALETSTKAAQSRDYGQATSYLDAALTMAHMVIDKMRKTGSGRARDVDSSSKRERLYRALDHVLDAKKVHTR